jgi:hypothetical protein
MATCSKKHEESKNNVAVVSRLALEQYAAGGCGLCSTIWRGVLETRHKWNDWQWKDNLVEIKKRGNHPIEVVLGKMTLQFFTPIGKSKRLVPTCISLFNI